MTVTPIADENQLVSSMPSGGHATTLHSHKSLADRSRAAAAGSSKHINAAGMATAVARRNQVNIKGLRVDLPLDDEDYLVPSPQSPQQQLPTANTPTNNNCNAYMDLIADPGPALNSASSVKGSDTMFPYPPPGYFLAGKKSKMFTNSTIILVNHKHYVLLI